MYRTAMMAFAALALSMGPALGATLKLRPQTYDPTVRATLAGVTLDLLRLRGPQAVVLWFARFGWREGALDAEALSALDLLLADISDGRLTDAALRLGAEGDLFEVRDCDAMAAPFGMAGSEYLAGGFAAGSGRGAGSQGGAGGTIPTAFFTPFGGSVYPGLYTLESGGGGNGGGNGGGDGGGGDDTGTPGDEIEFITGLSQMVDPLTATTPPTTFPTISPPGITPTISPVPLPAGLWFLMAGLGGFALLRRAT